MVLRKKLPVEDRLLVWLRVRGGATKMAVADEFGVSTPLVARIVKDVAMQELGLAVSVGRLSLVDREEISRGIAAGCSGGQIAGLVGVSVSTVNREIARNGGRDRYRACAAHERAIRCAKRPKPTVFEPAIG